MNYEMFNEELVKRYMFLHENKDIILAMCIRRINIDDELKADIESYEGYKKRLKISDKEIFDAVIDSLKKQLGQDKYYLCSKVSKRIVNAFEEVLFTDGDLEDTQLYKHVTALKNNPLMYESVMDMISDLEDRRKCNQHLSKIPTFTVWKILNYVRRKYSDNAIALEALDKYYNIERTMFTGMDSECGYVLKGEECWDDERLSKYYSSTIIGGVSGSYIICDYKGNKYETEDDYFVYESELDDELLSGEATTVFMDALSKIPMLSFEEKMNIRNAFYGDVKRTLE